MIPTCIESIHHRNLDTFWLPEEWDIAVATLVDILEDHDKCTWGSATTILEDGRVLGENFGSVEVRSVISSFRKVAVHLDHIDRLVEVQLLASGGCGETGDEMPALDGNLQRTLRGIGTARLLSIEYT
ncbi:unnamed protein product [Diplocarpon coronariae]